MNKIEIDHTGKWAEDMIAIKKIIEAELTAVKGVDELIEKRENNRQNLSYIASRGCGEDAGKYKQIMDCISDLKSLNQTPVAEEYPCTECGGNAYEGYIVEEGNCKIAKGERLCKKCMEKRNPDFIEQEERLKDSQPKEVEINKRDENREIINKIMKDINILSFKNCNGDKCIKTHQVNKSLEKYLTPEIVTSKD